MRSLSDVFAFVAGRVSARRPPYFLLLRQEKVSKEKATRVRVSLRCAKGNLRCSQQAGSLQTRLSPQTCNLLNPPVAALLGTRTREGGAEDQYQYQYRATRADDALFQSGSLACSAVMRWRATQCARAAGRRIRLAFLLATFLWRSKEKQLGRRAETRLAT
jgi:hypothetical protein